MKKTITIVFMTLFAILSTAYAGEVSAEFGMLPRTDSVDWTQQKVNSELHLNNIFFLDLAVKFDLPYNFFVGGDVKTFMVRRADDPSFFPFYSDYQFDIGWTYKWITIGYTHVCAHSVSALGWTMKSPLVSKDCSFDSISVKVKKEF